MAFGTKSMWHLKSILNFRGLGRRGNRTDPQEVVVDAWKSGLQGGIRTHKGLHAL